ncbi:MAG: acyl-CoA dehydrogenase [Anaerolineae bacterium]|jgi:acyl-CoA dehydrogenase|nr:acyl-CoA dehydrogenase [Anaerolineae bacterium]MBT4312002.1 acyl-CoA dehydrogenase [Anaerolineae bacterium]MBT4458150.1 acyl-CoA dehydrogenase [Anaerolineae bacterium]MBT4841905.1 acyl-CoA dehydrogenase [Anaerolineae bacterium]MBT6059589.1 acyl-CoA dehydrogenase [Anaerolineae bacterium]
MTIEFETPKPITQQQYVLKTVADNMMRPHSRYFDENEHEIPWDYINFMHQAMKASGAGSLAPSDKKKDPNKPKRPPIGYQMLAHMLEVLSWGDTGMYLITPGGGLGAAAVQSAGNPEQKKKFLARFMDEKPTFAAMCMTEADAGSDTSKIRANAVLDDETNEWVLNGEKIFVTAGDKALTDYEEAGQGFIVVWATIDPEAGRAGMRSFVVEAGTPGAKVTKMEHKLGIRASDTVTIVLQDVRVPFENILGKPTVEKTTKGFKGAMATFDATRPLVAAMGIGVARAALEFVQEKLAEEGVEIRYGKPRNTLTSIERDVIDMEVMVRSAWLVTLKAVWMADNRKSNALEASMSKVKAGDVGPKVTQKAIEILGPLGYSREFLLEKWFRDAKITDIYEGTGQINRLVVARNLLGYRGSQLR